MLIASFVLALASLTPSLAGSVQQLDADTFEAFVANEQATLVQFFAPWCGHCKRLAPIFSEAARELEGDGVRLGAVDCTEHKALCTRFGVRGYPTVKLFVAGDASPYSGARSVEALVGAVRAALPGEEVDEGGGEEAGDEAGEVREEL